MAQHLIQYGSQEDYPVVQYLQQTWAQRGETTEVVQTASIVDVVRQSTSWLPWTPSHVVSIGGIQANPVQADACRLGIISTANQPTKPGEYVVDAGTLYPFWFGLGTPLSMTPFNCLAGWSAADTMSAAKSYMKEVEPGQGEPATDPITPLIGGITQNLGFDSSALGGVNQWMTLALVGIGALLFYMVIK